MSDNGTLAKLRADLSTIRRAGLFTGATVTLDAALVEAIHRVCDDAEHMRLAADAMLNAGRVFADRAGKYGS